MSPANRYGDIVVTNPRAMRALAHPVRLAILSSLQRHGPSTASRLSPDVGATPSVTSWHLRHLASFGLVRDATTPGQDARERWWESSGSGFRFAAPREADDAEAASAYRALTERMFVQAEAQRNAWFHEVEPELAPRWRKLSGLANTRLVVTAAELAAIEERMEALLAPFVQRSSADAPRGSRGVRIQRFVMPDRPGAS
jgi:DNA-binding transcriptional ArsR family regulator